MSNAVSLKNQIANLQRKLARVNVSNNSGSGSNACASGGSKSARRRRRRNAGGRAVGARYIAPVVQNPNPRAGRVSRGGTSIDGGVRVRRKEYLFAVKQGSESPGWTRIAVSAFPWLKGVAKSFDRVTWHSLRIIYKPYVGTNTTGSFIIGVDWDSGTSKAPTYASVSAFTPVMEVPVWQSGVLVVPSSKLMTKKSYVCNRAADDKQPDDIYQPGQLCWTTTPASDAGYGHVWAEYDVTLFGTQS